ncbi:MAG: serine hydrolase domain-containing protein [Acidimicrobiales bacterium]
MSETGDAMPIVRGYTTEKFSTLREVFEQQLLSGEDVGASIAVILRGELVADIWGGFADEQKTTPWERDTIVNVWSVTKTMTFLVALMLSDRGELDFDAPVSRYWPEFAQQGKADIKVRDVMGHTSGLSGFERALEPTDLANWDLCVTALAEQAPWWEPGTASGYHLVTQGYLIGELVRRITGTSFAQFLKSEVTDIVGADFHIGLPESEESRVSLVIPGDGNVLDGLDRESIAFRSWMSPPIDFTWPWQRWWRAAEIPASNGHGNARSVAMVQSIVANNGEYNGTRFFSEKTGARIFETQAHGVDLVLGIEAHFGMGYGLASSVTPLGPRGCFWAGLGSLVVMDQDFDITIAYTPNKMQFVPGSTRGANIARAAVEAALR